MTHEEKEALVEDILGKLQKKNKTYLAQTSVNIGGSKFRFNHHIGNYRFKRNWYNGVEK